MMMPMAKVALLPEELSSLQPRSEDGDDDTEAGGTELPVVIVTIRRLRAVPGTIEGTKRAFPWAVKF